VRSGGGGSDVVPGEHLLNALLLPLSWVSVAPLLLVGLDSLPLRCRCATEAPAVDRQVCGGALPQQPLGTSPFLPDCFAGVPALATVELSSCGLASVPAALTALAGSLTSLAMPHNGDLQLAHGDAATLLALRKLRHLDLRKSSFENALSYMASRRVVEELHFEPALWTARSLQHLVTLPDAFRAQHGHALDLLMYEEEESSEEDDDGGVVDEDGAEAAQ